MPDAEFQNKLKSYASLLVQKGCALTKDKPLFIRANVEVADFVRMVAKEAYSLDCKRVTVLYGDEIISKMAYENCPVEEFESFPEWNALLHNSMALQGASVLTLDSEDPQGLKGIDPKKTMANLVSSHDACKDFYTSIDFGKTIWCIAGAASPAWAKKVFPNMPEEDAVRSLWEAILHTAHADGDDPISTWNDHSFGFEKHLSILNEYKFDSLYYSNSLGTDFTVGMNPEHIWHGGGDLCEDGREFFPNIPTEEVYTSPDKTRADGIVYASKPLIYQGDMIDEFWIEFKRGKVINFGAKKGYDLLKSIIETDENACRLGEVALVPFSSPINQTGILFYSTLFDENAACHVALGKGFPECLENGRNMDEETLLKHNLNQSKTHVDFMIGTKDLRIAGKTKEGLEVIIFDKGEWVL